MREGGEMKSDASNRMAVTLVSLQRFAEMLGRSAPTLWRYRRNGWLKTINIAGRPYVTAEDALEFERRASLGEFAKAPHGAARKGGRANDEETR